MTKSLEQFKRLGNEKEIDFFGQAILQNLTGIYKNDLLYDIL